MLRMSGKYNNPPRIPFLNVDAWAGFVDQLSESTE